MKSREFGLRDSRNVWSSFFSNSFELSIRDMELDACGMDGTQQEWVTTHEWNTSGFGY